MGCSPSIALELLDLSQGFISGEGRSSNRLDRAMKCKLDGLGEGKQSTCQTQKKIHKFDVNLNPE